jgi:hypothetical protein
MPVATFYHIPIGIMVIKEGKMPICCGTSGGVTKKKTR